MRGIGRRNLRDRLLVSSRLQIRHLKVFNAVENHYCILMVTMIKRLVEGSLD